MKQYLSYLKTVIAHRWWAYIYCCEMGVPLLGLVHDLTKFSPTEFGAYARHFHNPDGSKRTTPLPSAEWDRAWRHHQCNLHHWQAWTVDTEDGLVADEMPEKYVREMVADWMAAGRVYSGKCEVDKWYKENRNRMTLHPHTRLRVEFLVRQAASRRSETC